MSNVLAALDTSAAARAVLETAIQIGALIGADVDAVHVRAKSNESFETPEALAALHGVNFRLLEGATELTLQREIDEPGVLAAVVGSRSTIAGRRPCGHVVAHILEHATKPVVVVPPEAIAPGPFRRLLVPLKGDTTSSRTALRYLRPLLGAGIELVVLHVFTDATFPHMLDRPARDLAILENEFLSRHLPRGTRIELRPGPVAPQVVEMSRKHHPDLVVLSCSQDSTTGRSPVVSEVIGTSALPVLLLPVAPDAEERPGWVGQGIRTETHS